MLGSRASALYAGAWLALGHRGGVEGWTNVNWLVDYTSFALKILDNYYTLRKLIAFYYETINMGSCCYSSFN